MRPTSRPVPALLFACLLAAGAALAPRVADACHSYDHVMMLEEMGVHVPEIVKEALAKIGFDFTPIDYQPLGATPCVDGMAGPHPCSNVDLLAAVPLSLIGGGSGNDSWGWTDPLTQKEWVLMGRSNGTAFIDISDPTSPVYVANLPSQAGSSTWRDIKVYANHAFIVADGIPHGMQVFDLTRLRGVRNPPQTMTPDHVYTGFANAHNLAINEATGFAYAVGSNTCSAGLHMVNIQDPKSPAGAGCFSQDGYTHDVQCVVYQGPDVEHQGDEICFASNEDTVTIIDVTNKAVPVQLSETPYSGSAYTHQGWLTEDHRYFVHDDELDEAFFGHNTWTYVWDLSNLEQPVLVDHFESTMPAIDHNQYVHDGFTFQANYRAGLRILEFVDPANGVLEEVGFFDTYPANNSPEFSGAWSTYPYFDSGVVIVSDINSGLFVLQPHLPSALFEDGFESGDTGAWGEVVPFVP